MKILLKYIAHNLRDRKMRSLVMLLTIMLSTMLLLVSLSIGDSYAAAQRRMARGMAGSAALSVSRKPGPDGSKSWVSADALPDLPSIRHATGMVEAPTLYKENGYYENFDLIGADLGELAYINKPRLVDGGELTGFSGDRIVVPDRFASKFGVKKGDRLRLWIGEKPCDFEVAAVAAYDTVFLRHTRGTTALVPVETLSAILGAGGGYSELLVEPAEGVTAAGLQAELKECLPEGYCVTRVVNEAGVESSARQKSLPFFLISFFSLTMSVFIIFSSYKVITLERLSAIGTFRSVGATEKAVGNILMLESLLYGALGALTGVPAGFLVLRILLTGLGDSLSQGIAIPMIVSPVNILVVSLLAASVSVLSAWLPARRASRLPIKDVVLGKVETQSVSDGRKYLAGAALLALSIILPRVGRHLGDAVLFLTGGLSLAGLLTASILVIPGFTSLVSAALERAYGAVFGNEGRLAARNMRGNKNISQNITLLFISISAIIAITVVANFAQDYIGDVFLGAKLDGFSDASMTPEFVEKVGRLEGIGEVLPVRVLSGAVLLNDAVLNRVEGADDIAQYREMFAMRYMDEADRSRIEAAFGAGRNVLLSADCMKRLGLKAGDTVSLSSGGKAYDYLVLGGFKVRATSAEAIIPSSRAAEDFGIQNYGIVAYTAPDPGAVMVQLRNLFGNQTNWSRTVEEFNIDALGTIGAFLRPMRNLAWFILALAMVGVVNNLLINHMQKRRTASMYKSVGMSDRQNVVMTLIEGASSGMIGAALGVAVAWLEVNTIFLVAGPRIPVQPDIDPGTFLLAGLLGIGVTLAGSIVPIIKSRKVKLIEELKFD